MIYVWMNVWNWTEQKAAQQQLGECLVIHSEEKA